MTKKLLILISIALIIIISIWFFFFRTSAPTTPSTTSTTSPFGYGGPDVVPSGQTTKTPSSGLDSSGRPVAKLFQISNTPVSGAVAILKNGSTIIRYTDRATGHIIDANPETMEKIKISNKTLPKIYEAYYKRDGSGVVYRSLKEGDIIMNTSISLTAPKSTSTAETMYDISASMLRGDIGEMTILSSGDLVYSTNNPGSITSSRFGGDGAVAVYTTLFTEWRISPSGATEVYITTKAGGMAQGYSYKLNTKSGGLTKILGPLQSLITLANQDGKHVAYSYLLNNKITSQIKNLGNGLVTNLLPTTLVEKCSWSIKRGSEIFCGIPTNIIGANEPDSWYQGRTHFSDRIWVLDASSELAIVLAEPKKDLGVDIDVYNPSLSPDEDYLIFMNKTDLSLWALKLN